MKKLTMAMLLAVVTIGAFAQKKKAATKEKDAILVFAKTKGFRHQSIPKGKQTLMMLGTQNNFRVDTTEDAAAFTLENLKKYKAVVFLSTTGNILDDAQQAAFEQYIKGGGGYAGIHAAADTEYDWPWYNQLVGAYFLSHPKNQNVDIVVHSKDHPATAMLPDRWRRYDELYNYKKIVLGIKVLATLDEGSYKGGANGLNHPFIWYREFDGGRSFYTGGGHTNEAFDEPLFQQHLLGGIEYAMRRKNVKQNF
jgi:uncharacterized protein